MDNKSHILFALISLFSVVLLLFTINRENDREWKIYQAEYVSLLETYAATPEEKTMIRDIRPEVLQVVVSDRSRTDRCTTCHIAIEDTRFAEVPQPLRSHPEIPDHPFERFGCTICHGGIGQATTLSGAHEGMLREVGMVTPSGDIKYVEERISPVVSGDLVYSSCLSCHYGEGRKDEKILARGKSLYRGKGCMGCHSIGGVGGKVGPVLDFIGEKRTDPEWHLRHFTEPGKTSPGSVMPSYKDLSPKRLESLVALMIGLRRVPFEMVSGIPLDKKRLGDIIPPPKKKDHWDPPRGLKLEKNPHIATPQFLVEGKEIFMKFCSQCHGVDGKGRGTGSPNIEPKPADFTKRHTGMEHPIEGTFWKIASGRGLMPGWKSTFEKREIWALAEYVSSLGRSGGHEMKDDQNMQMGPGMESGNKADKGSNMKMDME